MASTTAKSTKVMTGADIVVQALVDHGVEVIFAYPGGCSMPMHQALTRYSDRLRTILPRHEQGGAFAAQGIARSTARSEWSWPQRSWRDQPGNLDRRRQARQYSFDRHHRTSSYRGDRYRRIPRDSDRRNLSRHYQASLLGDQVDDLPRIMKEAFHIATTGRPGPVLIDMPKDVQMDSCEVDWDVPMNLPGYRVNVPKAAPEQIRQVAAAIKHSRRPVIYAGGGIIAAEASEDLRELAAKTGIQPR